MDYVTIRENVQEVSDQFAQNRRERQLRRELVASDFDQLKEAGFHLTGVLAESGGLWESTSGATRMSCELLRILAHGDSSVALVCSMHPSVAAFWLATVEVPSPYQAEWDKQRSFVSEMARTGAWWGTITSEPGSGGDILQTKTIAYPNSGPGDYTISGIKHFGSGSGMTSFMLTAALPEGESVPDLFFMDTRDVPWDGSSGIELLSSWDGHGMIATQSHSMRFEHFPATRIAWPGSIGDVVAPIIGFGPSVFVAVIVGIIEVAVETARQQLQGRHTSMKPYEQVEWTRIELDEWLIHQAYNGMLDNVDQKGVATARDAVFPMTAVSELAESCMGRLCRVMGGGTYSRHSPFGFWFEDVRALGFLRPPWVLAYDQLFRGSWPAN